MRFFQWTNNSLETLVQIVDTALLFLPELINPVDAASAARNQYFMKVYAQRTMDKRPTPVVTIDESTVQSGDFLGAGLLLRRGWATRVPWVCVRASAAVCVGLFGHD